MMIHPISRLCSRTIAQGPIIGIVHPSRCLSSGAGATSASAAAAAATDNNMKQCALPPTRGQLRIVALRAAIPMVGFGIMDNLVMIQAGEFIDMSFGVMFGLSTLTAAGLGNCVSDVAGLTCGGIVDAIVAKLHLPHHGLTQAMLESKHARIAHTFGGCIGVVIGCLLGMTSLLFMDTDKVDRAKKARELTSIFESILEEGHNLFDAEGASLWILDGDNDELWTRVATGLGGEELRVQSDRGIVGACIQSGRIVNVADAYDDPRFNREVDKTTGFHTRSILAVPVKNDSEEVVGAIQIVNKKKDNQHGSDGSFTAADEKMALMLASHVKSFFRIVNGGKV